MSAQIDKESGGHVLLPALPSTHPQRSTRDASVERDYVEHRAAILAMLRADFPRLPDPEELYQEAWAELLALEARGETVRHRRGLLKKIAWRRAADATKRRRPDTVDPSSPVLSAVVDEQPLPDEQARLGLDGEALRVIVESLDDQQAAVLKLRFDQHLSAREVQGRLGISEKRLEAIVTAAYKKIAAQLVVDDGETRWTRRQRSLLLACELGIASAGQRRRAQSMVDRDPVCLAMLRAMRSSLNDVAAVLPMPVLVEERERVGGLARATSRLDELRVADARARSYFDLACREVTMNVNFTAVAGEVLEAIQAGREPKAAIEDVLARWRWFWATPSTGLSEEEVIGLFGELWFLEHWLTPLNRRVIEAWSGPTGDRHDFKWSDASIEVKATRARADGSATHRITALAQLEDPVQGRLHLFSLRAIPDAVGQHSLVRSIDRLRNQLKSQPAALVAFDERLGRAGYSPAHRDRYETLLRVQAEELYEVVDEFPRLTAASFPSGVPSGIDAISYTLDLAACRPWRLATAPNAASRELRRSLTA